MSSEGSLRGLGPCLGKVKVGRVEMERKEVRGVDVEEREVVDAETEEGSEVKGGGAAAAEEAELVGVSAGLGNWM